MKFKKVKKAKKQRGNTTHGHGARKKWRKSGHKGGVGMAGSGKKGDQKKTMITAKYGNKYFGKKGITSKGTARKKILKINLKDIEKNYDSFMKKFGKGDILDLSSYKLLGEGELSKKVRLKVKEASLSAIEKVKKAGGSVEILMKKDIKIIGDEESEPVKEKDYKEGGKKVQEESGE
jgi:large subunit ribosomal protein L15